MIARIRSILRRRKKDEDKVPGVKQEGDLIIDRAKQRVLDLTLSEFESLSFLADKKGWVFTRNQIGSAIAAGVLWSFMAKTI